MRVGFIGLGKLGLPVAEAMAVHYKVTGYDVSRRVSDTVKITDKLSDVVTDSDVIFIAVQTPHDSQYDGSTPSSHLPNKDFDYTHVKKLLVELDELVSRRHIVVLISTVLPGTTRRELAPLLTNANLVYNPYLIAMGTVAEDMIAPEMVMIGSERGFNDPVVARLIEFYEPIMQNAPRIIVGTWEEMECTKIFYNTFISAKLGLVNMIQDVAEKVGNINVDIVSTALAESTQRIMSPAYMKAGMGDGGPCHPRDNIALRWLAEDLNLGYDLFDAIMKAREVQADNLAHELLRHDLPVVILGKSFKPGVPYVDGSYSLLVGHYVDKYYDNWERMNDEVSYFERVRYDKISSDPAVYLLGHNDSYKKLADLEPGSVVVDPWRTAKPIKGVTIVPYGNTRGHGPRHFR